VGWIQDFQSSDPESIKGKDGLMLPEFNGFQPVPIPGSKEPGQSKIGFFIYRPVG